MTKRINKFLCVFAVISILFIFSSTLLLAQPPRPCEDTRDTAIQLKRLLQEKEAQGIDTSEARKLDRQSQEAMRQGRLRKCLGLLKEAIALLEEDKQKGVTGAKRDLQVDFSNTQGRIKNILGVNGGPIAPMHFFGLADDIDPVEGFRVLKIKFTRTHDINSQSDGLILSYFIKDYNGKLNDPENYDFKKLDQWVKKSLKIGTTPIITLEYDLKGNRRPPYDYDKWSEVATNVVLHLNGKFSNKEYGHEDFNEGDVTYFEIWNEPDLEEFWAGTTEEYLELYKTASQKIKNSKVGNIVKVGGPVVACVAGPNSPYYTECRTLGGEDFVENFLNYVEVNNLDLDFFDWHIYRQPGAAPGLAPGADKAEFSNYIDMNKDMISKLQRHGKGNTEKIISEFNFCFKTGPKGCTECNEFHNSPKSTSGLLSVLICFLDLSIDQTLIYNSQRQQPFDEVTNTIFNSQANLQYPGYAYKVFSEILDTPNRISVTGSDQEGYAVLAGKSNDGDEINILISDFNSSNEGYKLTLNNLPKGEYTYTIYAIDETHSIPCFKKKTSKCSSGNEKKYELDALESGTFTGVLEKQMTAPAVHLVKIKRVR